ncbi:MAG: radical SAM protein [Geobacteraceae bacterium]|nr:radical SAM protein [Geobacteraceae bacterium]NTW79388.1 radical SAM protein [Geobacteraceae bacterium]
MSNKLDVLLVNVGGTKKSVYQELSKVFSAIEPPFWAAVTAGFVRQHGFSVDILDANFLNLDLQETADAIIKTNAKLTTIVVYGQQANTCSPLMIAVGQLCSELKKLQPEIRILLTGWHPSALPQRTLEEEECDMIAQGEGFYTLLGLLQEKELSEIPGLWWKSEGKIFNNPRPKNIEDLTSELSDVAWDLLPMGSGKYRAFSWMCLNDFSERNRCATMYTSLGCPYQCKFCAIHATYGEHKIRYWSPEWVLRQIDILVQQYGVRHINLIDELFVFNPDHYLPIARGLIERNYGLNICAFARVDRIDSMPDDELQLLKKAGFNWFKLGIESVNGDVLRGITKGVYTREVISSVVKRCHDTGIDFCANFIFGLPGDTWDSMQENLNFAMELNCAFPSFFCTMAPPGSDLYDEALQNGTPLPEKWSGFAQQGYDFLPLPTETLSSAEVLWFRDYAFEIYFKNPRYLTMIERKFGREAREHVEEMNSIKLKRKLLGD